MRLRVRSPLLRLDVKRLAAAKAAPFGRWGPSNGCTWRWTLGRVRLRPRLSEEEAHDIAAACGFTLVELVVVIVVLGILGVRDPEIWLRASKKREALALNSLSGAIQVLSRASPVALHRDGCTVAVTVTLADATVVTTTSGARTRGIPTVAAAGHSGRSESGRFYFCPRERHLEFHERRDRELQPRLCSRRHRDRDDHRLLII